MYGIHISIFIFYSYFLDSICYCDHCFLHRMLSSMCLIQGQNIFLLIFGVISVIYVYSFNGFHLFVFILKSLMFIDLHLITSIIFLLDLEHAVQVRVFVYFLNCIDPCSPLKLDNDVLKRCLFRISSPLNFVRKI